MTPSDTPGAIRVLLVEDDAEFAEMCRLRLEKDRYPVEWARNGWEGVRLAHAWEPQLMFVDVRMPEMDGLELLRRLRADPITAAIPVVVLTNYEDDHLRIEAERLGILEWRCKVNTTPGEISTWIHQWSTSRVNERKTP